MIQLHKLISINRPSQKRVGRGIASGRGKTAGRGTKGQKSRGGYNIPRRFEGGQTPLITRLPKKRGFKHYGDKPLAINIQRLQASFQDGDIVSPATLLERGIIDRLPAAGIKIIGQSAKALQFQDVSLSKTLQEK